MVLDFKRAFLYADCERELYIELPDEDERKGKDLVGRLRKAPLRDTGCAGPVAETDPEDYDRPRVRSVEDDGLLIF